MPSKHQDALGLSLGVGFVGVYPRKIGSRGRIVQYFFKIIEVDGCYPKALLIKVSDGNYRVTTSQLRIPENCVRLSPTQLPVRVLFHFGKEQNNGL